MSQTLVYIGDNLIDIDPKTVISTSTKFFDLSDVSKRSVKYSNSFKALDTENNRALFGFSNDEKSLSAIPYTLIGGRVIEDGNEMYLCNILILDFDEDFTIQAVESSKDFFTNLDALGNVCDIDFGYYPQLNDAFIYNDRLNVSGYVTPAYNAGVNFPAPKSEFDGQDFQALEPWETVDSGESGSWVYDPGNGITYSGVFVSQVTNLLSNFEFKSFAGIRYTIIIDLTITSVGSTDFDVVVERFITTAPTLTNYTTAGAKQITITAIADKNSDNFTMYAENHLGTVSNVIFNKIRVYATSLLNIAPPFYLPCFYYKSIVEGILNRSDFDWDIVLTQEQQDLFDKMVFTPAKMEHSAKFVQDRTVLASEPSGSGGFAVVSSTPVFFGWVQPGVSFSPYWNNSYFEVLNDDFVWQADVRAFIDFSVVITGTGVFRVRLSHDTDTYREFSTTGDYQFGFEDLAMIIGDTVTEIGLVIYRQSGTGSASVTTNDGYFRVEALTEVGLPMTNQENVYPVNASNIFLPEQTAKSFISDFMVRFGIIALGQNLITLRSLQSIVNDVPIQKDRVNNGRKIDFTASGFAQENYFRDSNDEDTEFETDEPITLDNGNLDPEKDLYVSDFIRAKNDTIKSREFATVGLYNTESEYDISSNTVDPFTYHISTDFFVEGMRMMKVQLYEEDSSGVVLYATVATGDYLMATYVYWSELLELSYKWLTDSINREKIVTEYFNLSEVEFKQINGMPFIFDSGGKYLVLQITNYVRGKLTKLVLFKVK